MEEIAARLDALMARRDYDAAQALLLGAQEKAARAGDLSLELSLCSELLGFARISGREAVFTPVLARTRELLERVPISQRSRGTVLINAATALSAFHRGKEALPLYEQAERSLHQALPPFDRAFAALYNNAAACLESLGDRAGAEREYRRALAVLERYPFDPDRAVSYVNLAQLYFGQDPADSRAEACLAQAMEVFNDPQLLWDGYYAHTAAKCAPAFADMGREDLARELEERAEIIYEGT
ncbi:MAG: tetratricopeptide repeat protein [Oscillospiraceae bacterium]|nr:tetratricopeptide repeat protein [Oscillospiraceae bacterium]